MSHNTFGHLFRMTTFGESHGPAMGCVVDGCPPGIKLEVADIQGYLGRKLKASYDELVRQPVPDKFRQLLEELERREKKE